MIEAFPLISVPTGCDEKSVFTITLDVLLTVILPVPLHTKALVVDTVADGPILVIVTVVGVEYEKSPLLLHITRQRN